MINIVIDTTGWNGWVWLGFGIALGIIIDMTLSGIAHIIYHMRGGKHKDE